MVQVLFKRSEGQATAALSWPSAQVEDKFCAQSIYFFISYTFRSRVVKHFWCNGALWHFCEIYKFWIIGVCFYYNIEYITVETSKIEIALPKYLKINVEVSSAASKELRSHRSVLTSEKLNKLKKSTTLLRSMRKGRSQGQLLLRKLERQMGRNQELQFTDSETCVQKPLQEALPALLPAELTIPIPSY